MKQLKAFTFLISLTLLSSATFAEDPKEIKIGAILPLSGALHSIGEGSKKGMEMAVEDINAHGGVLGNQLKIVYEDSVSEPAKAVTALNVLETKIDIPVVTSELTSVIQALKPIADKKKILLAMGATHPDLVKDSELGIRNMLTSDSMVDATVTFITNMSYKNISVLSANEEWSVNALKILEEKGKELGFKINAIESVSKDELDLKPTLYRLKAKNPTADLTLFLLIGSVQSTAIKQAYLSKFSGPKLSWYVCSQPEVLQSLSPYYQDQASIEGYRPDELPSFQTFVKSYKEKYETDYPEYNAIAWYDSVHFISEAINAGNTTAKDIKSYITNKGEFEGALGKTHYSNIGDSVHKAQAEFIKGERCEAVVPLRRVDAVR